VSLTIQGYSPKLSVLAEKVFRDFGDSAFWGNVEPALVDLCKERMLRSLKSWSKERPDTQCDSLLSYFMQENVWLPNDRLEAAEKITSESFIKRAKSALIRRRTTSFIHGDLTQEAALSLCDQSVKILGPNEVPVGVATHSSCGIPVNADGDIPARARLLKGHTVVALADPNPEDPNSALLTHIQMEHTTARNAALMSILRSMMGEPLFAELRTKKQLGYIVSLSSTGYGRAPGTVRGLTVRLLSNRFSPLGMQDELGTFFKSQKEVFAGLTQADLSSRAAAIVLSLIDPPTSYAEEAGEFWGAIISGMPFDWTDQVVAELKALKVEDVQKAAEEWLFNGETRRSVSVMLFGNAHLEELKNIKNIQLSATPGFFPPSEGSVICTSLDELTARRDTLELFDVPLTDL
jgi:insulysin